MSTKGPQHGSSPQPTVRQQKWRTIALPVNLCGRKLVDGSQYTEDQIEFLRAMDDYKRRSQHPFPTWCEVLEVLLSLGYRKGQQ